jgi:hypothetical protein
MRAIDLRLWFIVLTIVVFIGISYQNARWLRADYESQAKLFVQEMLYIDQVSASTPSPRIIFAGGSSVIYAIDAQAIERDLGIRVINMGMLSRIGSDANYFDYLLPHIREGDLVIYSNQSWLAKWTQEDEANEARDARRIADRLWELARIDLAERDHVDWPLLVPIPGVVVFNRLRSSEWVDPWHSNWQRDDHGGIVQCPTKLTSLRPRDVPSTAPDRKVIARSGEFVRDVESRGARVIFFQTPILITEQDREKWLRYGEELRWQLAKIAPVLDATESLTFSTNPNSFCDSAFHIDDDVRAEWSQSLSVQLRQLPAVLALDRTGTRIAPLQAGKR